MGGRGSLANSSDYKYVKDNSSNTRSYYENEQTGHKYYAYEADVEGIPVYYERVSSASVSVVTATRESATFPELLKVYIDGVALVDETEPFGPNTVASMENGFITIYGNRTIDKGVIGHEAAHAFADGKWGSTTPPEGSDYRAAMDSGEPPVSEYGATTPGEDFAEAVRLYVTDPHTMINSFPERYQVVDRLMNEPDYGG